MRFLKIAFLVLFIIFSYFANSQTYNYEKAWQQIDSLQQKGYPEQALNEVESLYLQAEKDGESLQKVKSLVYKSNLRNSYQEVPIITTLNEIKAELKQAEGVERAMLLVALSDV